MVAGGQQGGPLEKSFARAEDTVESEQHAVAGRIDRAAERVELTGVRAARKTGEWEQSIFNTVGRYMRKGSNYIQSMDTRAQMDRVTTGIRRNPTQAMLIAAGAGAALGLLVMIRRR